MTVAEPVLTSTPHSSNYDAVTWYVSNAKQAASFFVTRYGFELEAYMGLETQSPDVTAQVVRLGNMRMVFMGALRAKASRPENELLVEEIHTHIRVHGDGIKDVSFRVRDVGAVYRAAVVGGAKGLRAPHRVADKHGSVTLAVISAYGDTTHTLVNREHYKGHFMPGYEASSTPPDANSLALSSSGLLEIDHCVANQGWDQMDSVCAYYEKALGFHRFWSVDDKQIATEYSALKSIVMASADETIKVPVNEPAIGKKKSQIEEFIEFYGGPGIQHIALRTDNIIETIRNLRKRGVEFISVPQTYYKQLRLRLASSSVKVRENLDDLERLHILVDFDENGYLLQLFTKVVVDRPTVFIEIIQRHNFSGFGAGNFKALFEAIEREQALRGTL